MVHAVGTPKRHPESGIYLFRKRVPQQLRESVGKREIKFSLRTRDPVVARIRNLEEMARLERAWSGIDGRAVDADGRVPTPLRCTSAPGAVPTDAVAATGFSQADILLADHSAQAAPFKAPVPLRPLFASYAREAQLAPATVKRWSPVVDRLMGHLGHDDAAAITRADVVAWKDALLDGGMSNVTVRDVYLAAAKAVLQFAVDQGRLRANPAKEVKVRVRKKVKEREKGFDGAEAEKILTATLKPFSHLISVEMRAARRWVPWICAYTGARVNEITPLVAADFVRRDGIWMIRIRGANNKTRSFREVPLHGYLIESGLLDYAKSRGTRPLFYDPGRSRGGKDSNPHHKKVAERLAEWVRSLGIEGVAPNHGWRHRFSTVSRFVGMPEDVRNIIQGHAGSKIADDYGETWPLVALREIEKLPRYVV
jgi:integrase